MNKLLSLVLIILCSPLFLILALIIFLDDGFPIFFRQNRIGLNKKGFKIFKFRTMKNNTPNIATHLLKEPHKTYTFSGPFLRKYSIDEIPQLLNIFLGHLKFIGPRPALYNQYDLIELRDKKGINNIVPGVTGWAQVNGRDSLSLKEKVEMDYYYLTNQSFKLNLKILFLTVYKVLKTSDVY